MAAFELHPALHAAREPRRLLALLAVPVLLAHLPAFELLDPARIGAGDRSALRRIQVAFVRELKQQQPEPAALAAPKPVRAAQRPLAPTLNLGAELAALPPEPAASVPAPLRVPEPLPPLPEAVAAPATEETAPVATATAAAAPASAADPARAFEWPPSTRLNYTLTGWYRGAVEGQARVEWLQRESRYQVHLEVSVGPSVAPLMSRRMSSEGEVGAAGLQPRRYEEETRQMLRAARIATIRFDGEQITLANGSVGERPAGVQDSASQFVQMTWMFTLQPQLLEAGRSLQIPLALPRRVETWTYDVLGRESLDTPAGTLDTVHVKPRREARRGGDLTAEFWVAPTLQYLPVRILIRQDTETFLDLLLERLPHQADAAAPATPR